MFKPQPLKFKHDALEPFMSEKTVDFHYNKHTKGYFDKTNKLIKDTTYDDAKTLEEVVKRSTSGSKLHNNAAQAWNHDFYWKCLTDKETEPSDELLKQIKSDFKSLDQLKKMITEKGTGLFGSGWVWVIHVGGHIDIAVRGNDGTALEIVGTTKVVPLFVVDVWEHAYYLDFQNDREEFIKQFLEHINWDFVNEQYRKATKEKGRTS